MNHAEAEESQAVERYTLDDMRQEEREAFEEHYFDCRVCSEGVRDSARMMAAGRRVARETVPAATNVVRMPPRWKRWIPAAAAALLLMVNGAMLFVQRSAPAMDLVQLSPVDIEADASRGSNEKPEEIRIRAERPTVQPVDLPPRYASYEINVRNSAGRTRQQITVSANQAKETVNLLLRPVPAGSYVLEMVGVTDGNRTELSKKQLTVQ